MSRRKAQCPPPGRIVDAGGYRLHLHGQSQPAVMRDLSGDKMTSGALALVVALPGRLSDGWRALLLATPQIADVRQVDDASSVLELVEALGPDLVLLDTEPLGERAWAVLNQIKTQAPQCRCIALISSILQQQDAQVAGADEVLIKGSPAGRLSAAVERLLPEQKAR